MEIRFENAYLEKLYADLPLPGKPRYSEDVVTVYRSRIRILRSLQNSTQIRQFKSFHFEALKGDKKGLHSIRIDRKYRLEFTIEKDRIMFTEIISIENLSNHYK